MITYSFDHTSLRSLNLLSLDQLSQIIQYLPFAAHIRSTKTGKYIAANQFQASNQGFHHPEQFINLTFPALCKHRIKKIEVLKGSILSEERYQECIEQANLQVEVEQRPLHMKVSTLFPTGFVYIGTLKKIPLFNPYPQLVGVLSFSQETTSNTELLDLFTLYKKYYSTKQAIAQFLRYLNIANYFHQLLTHQELLTLLLLRQNIAAKYVARQLKIHYRTVEEYKASLRDKLKPTMNLDTLLILLRK